MKSESEHGPNPARIPCSSPQPMNETCYFMINIYRVRNEMNMLSWSFPIQYNYIITLNTNQNFENAFTKTNEILCVILGGNKLGSNKGLG